jgi:hypothetical protein
MMTEKEPFVGKFMKFTDHAQRLFGPAARGDMDAPVVHRHDEYEAASEQELSDFEEETDSEGHHYAVRKTHPAK